VVLCVMRLFAGFRVCGLGKSSFAQVYVRLLRFFLFTIIQVSLIKRTYLKSKLYKFCINKYNTKLSFLIN
jgi:hypothetical protein